MANVTNLVTNPSFETNMTGWSAFNASISRNGFPNVEPNTGSWALLVTASVNGASAGVAYNLTGLTPGVPHTVSFYTKIQATGNDFSVVPSIDGVYTSQGALLTGDVYQRRFVGFTPKTSTATLRIFSEQSNVVGDLFWVDRVAVAVGGLLPYFDGSSPFSSWNGTANASTSTNTVFTTASLPTTDEVLVVNGLCLNTLAWNVTTKTGRYTTPIFRGDDITLPGVNGRVFVPNKPIDSGILSLSMYILGAHPDGSVPSPAGQRAIFAQNYEKIVRQCLNASGPITIYAWQPNGSVRTCQATLVGGTAIDPSTFMGGRRAEVTLGFEILSAVWTDYFLTTVAGTAGSGWSSQSLSLSPLAGGTAPIDDSVITVAGPITNPVVSNAATGTSVSLTGTVPNGQSWVVDCGAWTSKINGSSVLQNTQHVGHPRFLLIDNGGFAGDPIVSLTGTSTGAATNLSITASRKHLVG